MSVSYNRAVQVTVDGLPLPTTVSTDGTLQPNVLGVTCRYGYDLRVSEARVSLANMPSWASEWSWVVVKLGGPNAPQIRFAGYLVEVDRGQWPKSVDLICRGPLVKAQLTTNQTPDGTPFANTTDEYQVDTVLAAAGIADRDIQGTGRTLGGLVPKSFIWQEGQSALAYIELLDAVCLGYRIFDGPGGSVLRRQVRPVPGPTASYSYTEGVDIFSAALARDVIQARNLVQVTGAIVGTATDPVKAVREQDAPFLDGMWVTEQRSSVMIERSQETDPGPGLSCGAVADWVLADLNRRLIKVEMTTYRDEVVSPGTTIRVTTPRLDADRLYWVQSVEVSVDAQGFTQRLVCVTGDSSSAPVIAPPLVDFELSTEREVVIVAGAEATLTVARCRDTSSVQSGTLVSRSWTATGGGTPSTGSDPEFLSGYADIGTATITLTITDSNGITASRTKAVQPAAQTPVLRVIVAAEGPAQELALFDGSTWKTEAVGLDVVCCGNAPIWGAGDRVYRTLDRLATPALYSVPLAGVNVITLSATRGFSPIGGQDLPGSTVVAGLANGQIAVSRDGAQSWTLGWIPDDSDLIWAGASPYDAHFIQIVQRDYSSVTFDDGAHWSHIFAVSYPEQIEDANFSAHAFGSGTPSSHFFATNTGRVVRSEDGAELTFPSMSPPIASIRALASAIGEDRMYAIDDQGRQFYSDPPGSLTMVAGGIVPQPGLQSPGHPLQADGEFEGLLYAVFGSAGAYKNVGGLKGNSAWYPIRVPGVGNCPSTAVLRMIGFGELLTPSITDNGSPLTFTSSISNTKALSLWNGSGNNGAPAGWQNRTYDDSGWSMAVSGTNTGGSGAVTGADILWATSAPQSTTEQVVLRQAIALPLGQITSATLEIGADDAFTAWINGIFVANSPVARSAGTVQTVTVSPSLLLPGQTNIIAVQGINVAPVSAYASWKLTIT